MNYLNSHRPQYEMCLWFREVGLHLWRHANQGAVGHNSYHTHGFKGELWTERGTQLQSVRNWAFFESWTQSITILSIDLCGWFRKCCNFFTLQNSFYITVLLRTKFLLFVWNDKVYCMIMKFYYHLTSNINKKRDNTLHTVKGGVSSMLRFRQLTLYVLRETLLCNANETLTLQTWFRLYYWKLWTPTLSHHICSHLVSAALSTRLWNAFDRLSPIVEFKVFVSPARRRCLLLGLRKVAWTRGTSWKHLSKPLWCCSTQPEQQPEGRHRRTD